MESELPLLRLRETNAASPKSETGRLQYFDTLKYAYDPNVLGAGRCNLFLRNRGL